MISKRYPHVFFLINMNIKFTSMIYIPINIYKKIKYKFRNIISELKIKSLKIVNLQTALP